MLINFNKDKFALDFRNFRGNRHQNEVADELQINRTTISLLENGKQIPSLEILQKFCEKTQVTIDSFFVSKTQSAILMLMGQLKESDKSKLNNVFNRIQVREKYIAINKRCGK